MNPQGQRGVTQNNNAPNPPRGALIQTEILITSQADSPEQNQMDCLREAMMMMIPNITMRKI